MGACSEDYIELAEEWINYNPITGFVAREKYDPRYHADGWEMGSVSSPKKIKRTIKKKDLKVW